MPHLVKSVFLQDGKTDHCIRLGSFAGLPEGAVVMVDEIPLQITYTAGDGNDVALIPSLVVDIPTDLQTRMGITERKSGTLSLAGMLGEEPLPLSDPELSDLAVFSIETDQNRINDKLRTPEYCNS